MPMYGYETPDDGQKEYPKTCSVIIPIKLELSASVGFIHKGSIRMHGYTVLKSVKTLKIKNFAGKN
jgi:hypothetical protein